MSKGRHRCTAHSWIEGHHFKTTTQVLPEIFGTSLPQKLIDDVNACETDDEVIQVGIAHTVNQARALLDYGVAGVHFFTMNNSRVFNQILREFQG